MPVKILIVEEHKAVRNALRDWLKVEFPRDRLCEAVSGEQAITIARRENPDLVVMDMCLSGMNGIEVARSIKTFRQYTKIVILATHADKIYRDMAKEAGVNAYIPKREVLTELIPTVVALLSNGTNRSSS
ncbi:MAG: response regulator transcription factor [Chloroflexota bacterium]